MKAIVLTAALFAAALPGAAHAHGDLRPYPHIGDFYHDGAGYADSLQWSHAALGGYNSSVPGYEFSFSVDSALWSGCTSWTNLPYAYDDCPTAGYTEPSGVAYTFGVGSYDAKKMTTSGTTYEHRFYLTGGSTAWANAKVSWQEVSHQFCAQNSVWCMNGVQGGSFTDAQLLFRSETYKSWSF